MSNYNDKTFPLEEVPEGANADLGADMDYEAAKITVAKIFDGKITEDDDEKLTEAAILTLTMGKISTSMLQRRLSVGYGRAAKIIDRLESLGLISAPVGAGPRKALIDCPGNALPIEAEEENVLEVEDFLAAFDSVIVEKMEREAPEKVPSATEICVGDDLIFAAAEIALELGKLSTSILQRRLSIGYGRAAMTIDRLEELGVLSPPDGTKPRAVLVTREQLDELKNKG